jgi:hypothetical protein
MLLVSKASTVICVSILQDQYCVWIKICLIRGLASFISLIWSNITKTLVLDILLVFVYHQLNGSEFWSNKNNHQVPVVYSNFHNPNHRLFNVWFIRTPKNHHSETQVPKQIEKNTNDFVKNWVDRLYVSKNSNHFVFVPGSGTVMLYSEGWTTHRNRSMKYFNSKTSRQIGNYIHGTNCRNRSLNILPNQYDDTLTEHLIEETFSKHFVRTESWHRTLLKQVDETLCQNRLVENSRKSFCPCRNILLGQVDRSHRSLDNLPKHISVISL